jgi:hypothetical protein
MHEWRKSTYSTQGESNCVEVCDVVLHEVGDGVEGGSA